jgi:hypothetical protein
LLTLFELPEFIPEFRDLNGISGEEGGEVTVEAETNFLLILCLLFMGLVFICKALLLL